MNIKCDLHVHTCLSPCGDLGASPSALVLKAAETGIGVMAVCDHNSALNCPAAVEAGKRAGVFVIPGIEVATRDEVHILALFPSVESALDLGSRLYELLPPLPPAARDAAGPDQVYVDIDEVILGEVDKFLAAGADIGIEDILSFVHGEGGIVIPSHIDKPVFSIISQLGFIPDLPFDAVEIFSPSGMQKAGTSGLPVITSSDAHFTDDLGRKGIIAETENVDFFHISELIKGGSFSRYFG